MLINFILSGENPEEDIFILADINEDNILNIQDLILLIGIILD